MTQTQKDRIRLVPKVLLKLSIFTFILCASWRYLENRNGVFFMNEVAMADSCDIECQLIQKHEDEAYMANMMMQSQLDSEPSVLGASLACDINFKNIITGKNVWIPDWFKELLGRTDANCEESRYLTQIAYYESGYCHGDTKLCGSIIGSCKDTGLFQYLPSTWSGKWNVYRGEGINDANAQIKASLLKVRLFGGVQKIIKTNFWTTSSKVRI